MGIFGKIYGTLKEYNKPENVEKRLSQQLKLEKLRTEIATVKAKRPASKTGITWQPNPYAILGNQK
jgi:hypothetical protein